jgi:OmcA/MtrC family decaheme c-type cytochrome
VRKHFILLSVLCLILPLLFLGCEGDDGAAGIAGTPGTPGDPGPGALANETCVVCHGEGRIADVAVEHDTFTGTADIQIDDASFNTADNTAAVTFTVVSATDANGVDITDAVASVLTDLDPNNSTRLAHMRFTIARLIPGVIYGATGRDPDSWDFYGPRSHRTASQLVDNGGNNFTFTFVDDVALDPGEVGYTHRVGIEIYNLPSGLRSVNPTFDFVPDGVTPLLTREIVVTANCNECHDPLGYTPRFHGSRRVEIKHCVLCHNPNDGLAPESADPGAPNVPIPFVKLVHAIHTAQFLNIFEDGENEGDFTDNHFPQDIRNCTKCHKGGADSDNWKNRPTIEACGSCHGEDIFLAGGEHPFVQTDNSGCIACHQADSGGIAPPISVAHRTENVTPNNQELPTGLSRFEYFIDNVAVDNTGVATVGFRITRDGAPFDLQTWEDGEGTTFTDRSPTFLLAWALPQDGIDTPAEYNNLNSPDPPSSSTGNGAGDAASISIGDLWTAGNITGDSAGYTATISTLPFPAGATMRAVALQSYFNQIVGTETIGRHTPSVMAPVPGDAVRRQVVKSGYTNNNDPLTGQPEGCLECHETLELHGGSRVNNVQVCVFCHNPNKSSSGRTADPTEPSSVTDPEDDPFLVLGPDPLEWPEATNNFKNMIHGIHKASDRPYQFVRNRLNGILYDWSFVTFPGDLMDCTKCHIGESYVPSNVPANTLWNVERTTTGDPNETREDIIAARSSVPNLTDLVDSPIAGACFYCHDDGTAKSHILLQGGKLSIWPDIDTTSGATTREDALGLP